MSMMRVAGLTCAILVIAKISVGIEELEFDSTEIEVVIWPLFLLFKRQI